MQLFKVKFAVFCRNSKNIRSFSEAIQFCFGRRSDTIQAQCNLSRQENNFLLYGGRSDLDNVIPIYNYIDYELRTSVLSLTPIDNMDPSSIPQIFAPGLLTKCNV